MSNNIVTRFAPSPTGFLHIGGARTALFNWLYARGRGGKMVLRIEDTDRERSTDAAIDAIIEGMRWLGLDWDGEPVFQFSRAERHREVAQLLLEKGLAYRCYATQDELATMREEARAKGGPSYNGLWRDKDPSDAPEGVKPAIRLKAPRDGETLIRDHVQGDVKFPNKDMDDFVLLRADETPTYMLAVVVDDHDMGVTHVIRGDDHLTNAARQSQIYTALSWTIPEFGHIPLIHGPDGAKLSKRHGALGVEAYREMGYTPETMLNYLARLGWAHGDDEIFSMEQAKEWFDFNGIGKGPSRFDFKKLDHVSGHYIRSSDDADLYARLLSDMGIFGANDAKTDLFATHKERIMRALPALKERAKTLKELYESTDFLLSEPPLEMEEGALKHLASEQSLAALKAAHRELQSVENWDHDHLSDCIKTLSQSLDMKLGQVAQPIRSCLTGKSKSPGAFDVLLIFGKEESLRRIEAFLNS